MFIRLRSALAAWIAPTTAPVQAADRLRADEITNTAGNVSDGGRAVQARDVQDLHLDTHHHTHDEVHHHTGGGGIVNMGGTNTFANTAIGHGATIHTGHGDINQNS